VRTALFVSPHLDDVAFSCGGIAHRLARRGWKVVVATVFTRSIHPARGFALACQRDKGLPDEIDYMAVRRDEDREATAALGVTHLHLDLPEAPHRGYESATALFGAVHDDPRPVADELADAIERIGPDTIVAPQGCGGHVDHLLVIDALRLLKSESRTVFYRDTPYVIRDAGAIAYTDASISATVSLDDSDLGAKQNAAVCYKSQVGFQFGGRDECRAALAMLASREAEGVGFAERLLAHRPPPLELLAT
jgi:LmbE family N-acetylglucosaminyl deacetylase